MDPTSLLGRGKIDTQQAQFLLPSDDGPPRSILLRGVNLSGSAKYPNLSSSRRPERFVDSREGRDELQRYRAGVNTSLSDDWGLWSDAEKGGEDGWFVDKPLKEEEADLHLKRLRAWGFTTIRLIVTWEALEHAGPGKYDELYIDYLIRLLQKCKAQGFRVFVSPHQDVFSRFIGGSGAPYWLLEAFGISPRRIHSTCAAVLHSEYMRSGYHGEEGHDTYPDMIWNTNENRLAARHCSTMFFASNLFAPKCTIDGMTAGEWARRLLNEAYGHLADRVRDAGGLLDDCLIGWDSMNEPHQGFIGVPDLGVIPDSQEFRKGPCPTPLQGFRLAVGEQVENVSLDDFTSLGLKNLGTITFTPPQEGLWLTREESDTAQKRWGYKWGTEWNFWDHQGQAGCPWAGHGVWNKNEGKLLKPDYFEKWQDGREYDFMADFWRPYYVNFIKRIRSAHPHAISLIHPAIFEMPPDLTEDIKSGRMVLSAHFYDGLTMIGKRRHKFNANTVGLHRGHVGMLGAAKLGTTAVRNNLRQQFQELSSDAHKVDGIAREEEHGGGYPTLIGELGSPFDMKKTKWFGILRGKDDPRDYTEPAKAMDELLNGCDGSNALSWTLWNYEPTNTHAFGDGWNMEDLSIFTYDDLDGDDDMIADKPADLRQLVTFGARGMEAWCRPYPISVIGSIVSFSFDMGSSEFDLVIDAPYDGTATIFLPYVHYLRQSTDTNGQSRLIGKPDDQEWRSSRPAVIDVKVVELSSGSLDARGQLGTWTYTGPGHVRLKLKRWGDKPDLEGPAIR